jgi:hypothetical protein
VVNDWYVVVVFRKTGNGNGVFQGHHLSQTLFSLYVEHLFGLMQ